MLQTITILCLLVGSNLANPLKNVNTRVVNGTDVAPGTYPFIASVRDEGGHYCGGSILNSRWVLTAAHCVYSRNLKTAIVHVVGTNSVNDPGDKYYLEKIIMHEQYNHPPQTGHDIALLKTIKEIDFSNPLVEPADIDFNYVPGNRLLTAMGWGMSDIPQKTELQQLHMFSWTIKECQKFQEICRFDEICVYAGPGQGVCNGDSGGPLVYIGTNKLVGIAERSGRTGCVNGFADVFIRTSSHKDWILDHLAND